MPTARRQLLRPPINFWTKLLTKAIIGIESLWSFAKARLHQFKGVPKHTFLLHLKESEFRFNHRYENLYKLLLNLLRQQPL